MQIWNKLNHSQQYIFLYCVQLFMHNVAIKSLILYCKNKKFYIESQYNPD